MRNTIDIMDAEKFFLWAWIGGAGGLVGSYDTMDECKAEIGSWKCPLNWQIVRNGETVAENRIG